MGILILGAFVFGACASCIPSIPAILILSGQSTRFRIWQLLFAIAVGIISAYAWIFLMDIGVWFRNIGKLKSDAQSSAFIPLAFVVGSTLGIGLCGGTWASTLVNFLRVRIKRQ